MQRGHHFRERCGERGLAVVDVSDGSDVDVNFLLHALCLWTREKPRADMSNSSRHTMSGASRCTVPREQRIQISCDLDRLLMAPVLRRHARMDTRMERWLRAVGVGSWLIAGSTATFRFATHPVQPSLVVWVACYLAFGGALWMTGDRRATRNVRILALVAQAALAMTLVHLFKSERRARLDLYRTVSE